jgi:hypothetical protein
MFWFLGSATIVIGLMTMFWGWVWGKDLMHQWVIRTVQDHLRLLEQKLYFILLGLVLIIIGIVELVVWR